MASPPKTDSVELEQNAAAPPIDDRFRAAILADATLPEPVRKALLAGMPLERITLDDEGRWWHEGDTARIFLSDGSDEPLDLSSLRYVPARGFYCTVKRAGSDGHKARFSRPAYYALTEHIEADKDGRSILVLGNTRTSIAGE